jgi:hypothetical protein
MGVKRNQELVWESGVQERMSCTFTPFIIGVSIGMFAAPKSKDWSNVATLRSRQSFFMGRPRQPSATAAARLSLVTQGVFDCTTSRFDWRSLEFQKVFSILREKKLLSQ